MMGMKNILFLLLLLTGSKMFAQSNKSVSKDSTISFKVFGACVQCKHRIEEAVKGKGVKSAAWNVDTKQLLLVYDPAKTTLNKIS